jgi:oligopeptide/dipeptide ABC transporter ATP-binding protein
MSDEESWGLKGGERHFAAIAGPQRNDSCCAAQRLGLSLSPSCFNMPCMGSLLEVRDLRVRYRSRAGATFEALDGVSFGLDPGEVMGVLGESGSGKSTLAASLLGLLRKSAAVVTGEVAFEGRDLMQAGPDEFRRIRGRRISIIFQEPSIALHPTMRVGGQVRQVLAAHGVKGRELDEKTREAFEALFAEEPERMARSYPHQLSGGQRQRVLISQAIACRPSLLIADEPTASLDATTQVEILGVFRSLRKELGLAMIFITHNPALLSGFADRVLVLYAGKIVELGPAASVLASPGHPYTRALLQSMPPLVEETSDARKKKLATIPGDSLPSSLPQKGCPFEPRCADKMDTCKRRAPTLVSLREGYTVSCFKYESQEKQSTPTRT